MSILPKTLLRPNPYASSAFGGAALRKFVTQDSICVFMSKEKSVFKHTRLFTGWHKRLPVRDRKRRDGGEVHTTVCSHCVEGEIRNQRTEDASDGAKEAKNESHYCI